MSGSHSCSGGPNLQFNLLPPQACYPTFTSCSVYRKIVCNFRFCFLSRHRDASLSHFAYLDAVVQLSIGPLKTCDTVLYLKAKAISLPLGTTRVNRLRYNFCCCFTHLSGYNSGESTSPPCSRTYISLFTEALTAMFTGLFPFFIPNRLVGLPSLLRSRCNPLDLVCRALPYSMAPTA